MDETGLNSLVLTKAEKCLGLHKTAVFKIFDQKLKHLQL